MASLLIPDLGEQGHLLRHDRPDGLRHRTGCRDRDRNRHSERQRLRQRRRHRDDPRHRRVDGGDVGVRLHESEPVVQDVAPTPAAAEPTVVEPAPVVAASSETSNAPVEAPAPAPSLWARIWGKSEPQPAPLPAPEIQDTAAVEYESKSESEPSEPPVAPHWMDALAPNQINATGGDWMNKLSAPQADPVVASSPAEEPVEAREQVTSPIEAFESVEPAETHPQSEVRAAIEAPAPQNLFPISHAVHEEQPAVETSAPAASSAETEAAESWFAPTPSVFDRTDDPVSIPVPVASSQPDQALELDSDHSSAPVGLRDPELETSPAVHVTPEPLLVEDEAASQGSSEYNSRPQEVSALHSYSAPASGDRGAEHPAAEEPPFPASAREEMPVPSFEPPATQEADERIPTGPPPNREALASIPFLTPPPEFRASAPEPVAPNQGTVDEVVRKVLERLEPQIHDLLSQGVLKPLVESLLQNELAKKDK